MKAEFRTAPVFGVPYAVTDYEQSARTIVQKALNNEQYSVFALPVHGVIERRKDQEFGFALTKADLIVPDGQPIRWMMNYLHDAQLADRVYGPKLLHRVLSANVSSPLRVFVYGGRTPEVLEQVVKKLQATYLGVDICGSFREESADVQTLTGERVNAHKPNLVIVGLGLPNQEKWIARNTDQIDAAVMGVGAAFGFFSGDLKSAPGWMQKNGLEWLYRLSTEPRRLWKRYLYTNSYFVWLVIAEVFKRQFGRL